LEFVVITISIGKIVFYILDASIPFLFSLKDMNRLKIYLNNVTNEIISTDGKRRAPVIRKWGHPWFFTSKLESALYLTDVKLKRLHRRFGHPATDGFCKLLKRAGHEKHRNKLEKIEKFCHKYQINGPQPSRFKFPVRNDCEFNHKIIINVLHLISRPVLHYVNRAIAFQDARFLPFMSAADAGTTFRKL
jgi:hypothetical protein